MKADLIKAGFTYSDGKFGVRRVVALGSDIRTLGENSDALGVRYEILMSTQGPSVYPSSAELKSFATWAKQEIPAGEVDDFVNGLKASKLVKRLSSAQISFLRMGAGARSESDRVTYARRKFSPALVCKQKELVASMPAELQPEEKTFEVRFTPLGLKTIEALVAVEHA